MTEQQAKLLQYIRHYYSLEGRSPSFDEMRVRLGLKSKSGVHRLVTSLVERGYVAHEGGQRFRARNLIPLNGPLSACPKCGYLMRSEKAANAA